MFGANRSTTEMTAGEHLCQHNHNLYQVFHIDTPTVKQYLPPPTSPSSKYTFSRKDTYSMFAIPKILFRLFKIATDDSLIKPPKWAAIFTDKVFQQFVSCVLIKIIPGSNLFVSKQIQSVVTKYIFPVRIGSWCFDSEDQACLNAWTSGLGLFWWRLFISFYVKLFYFLLLYFYCTSNAAHPMLSQY